MDIDFIVKQCHGVNHGDREGNYLRTTRFISQSQKYTFSDDKQ